MTWNWVNDACVGNSNIEPDGHSDMISWPTHVARERDRDEHLFEVTQTNRAKETDLSFSLFPIPSLLSPLLPPPLPSLLPTPSAFLLPFSLSYNPKTISLLPRLVQRFKFA